MQQDCSSNHCTTAGVVGVVVVVGEGVGGGGGGWGKNRRTALCNALSAQGLRTRSSSTNLQKCWCTTTAPPDAGGGEGAGVLLHHQMQKEEEQEECRSPCSMHLLRSETPFIDAIL